MDNFGLTLDIRQPGLLQKLEFAGCRTAEMELICIDQKSFYEEALGCKYD